MQIYKDWFDKLELILKEEAEFAGLLSHSTSVGSAREFFVRRFLKSFLPDFVHVGTGQIISKQPNPQGKTRSKQVDVVVFDSRFSYLKSPSGSNLYPVEGTIATIEVKSELTGGDGGTLFDSLDNCLSVIDLGYVPSTEEYNLHIPKIMSENNVSLKEAEQIFLKQNAPATYIFSFLGYKARYKELAKSVYQWLDNIKCTEHNVPLPCVIAAEGCILVSSDSFNNFKIREDKKVIVAEAIKTEKRLGYLACHILSRIAKFTPDSEKTMNCAPLDQYNKEISTKPALPILLKLND
jgi:hypothetical protein